MIDATRFATPMPEQPLATMTSTRAPISPADPLPVFVTPSATDPVSNHDFLPVDDAYAPWPSSRSVGGVIEVGLDTARGKLLQTARAAP